MNAARNDTMNAVAALRPPVALTIAGTDPSGGAGIQADLKTFSARGAYGTSVITALVAQNTHGVSRVYGIDEDFVADELASVLGDMPVDAVKTGMLGTRALVELVVDRLAAARVPCLVVDPVMVATSGHRLLAADAVDSARRLLLPLAGVVTPNLPEAALLLGDDVAAATSESQMRNQAVELVARGAGAALVKGGHGQGATVFDVLAVSDAHGRVDTHVFNHPRVDTVNTHGTGCTLSSAITAELAKQVQSLRTAAGDQANSASGQAVAGSSTPVTVIAGGLRDAVFQGLEFLSRALVGASNWQLSFDMDGAHGPVDHLVDMAPVVAGGPEAGGSVPGGMAAGEQDADEQDRGE